MNKINTLQNTEHLSQSMAQAKSLYGCRSFVETQDYKGFESFGSDGRRFYFYPNKETHTTDVFVA